MLVALLLYAYRRGVSSSREIERRCSLDVGFRAVMAQQTPDHATIARFRRQFMPELSGLFTTILRMCAQAGLVKLGTISIDGTKLEANAARSAGHTADRLGEMARELLEKAEAADRAEDELHGPDRRGDELPAALADPKTRPAALRQAEVRPNHAYAGPRPRPGSAPRRPRSITTTSARSERPCRAKSAAPKRPDAPGDIKANVTDPSSRILKGRRGYCQGYNGQAAVSGDQIVVAAGVCDRANDMKQLAPMLGRSTRNLRRPV